MNYNETIDFLYEQLPCYQRIGKAAYKEDLHNTIALLNAIGNPQNSIKSIHIAGTNGKGSVSHMCASILQEAGYKTGLYTSPHLINFRERIKINGEIVSKKYITTFVKKNLDIIATIKPSFFEITVAMAFDYFAKENVDFAVIETGLGGRLDSTNVITPLISVITNIGLDHTQLLGNTLQKIAGEKAGIIKPKVPVIIGETQSETKQIFIEKAIECKSEILFADSTYSIEYKNKDFWHSNFSIKHGEQPIFSNLSSELQGLYQQKNILTVIATIEKIKQQNLKITLEHISKGLKKTVQNTGFMGRWQIIQKEPLIVCDTAHNYDGISIAIKQLTLLNKPDIHIIWGMVNDKDISQIVKILPRDAKYYLTKPNIERGMDVETLASFFLHTNHAKYSSIATAYKSAKRNLNSSSVLYIGGSTFVVAEFLSKKIKK